MDVLIDSTVLFHIDKHNTEIKKVFNDYGIKNIVTSRFNYLEILSGAYENKKLITKKFLSQFTILEFSSSAQRIANNLSMKYRIDKSKRIDFLIASIAIANKLPLLTENDKDFQYKEIKLLPYKISKTGK